MSFESFLDNRVSLFCGDNRDVLRSMPTASVHSIVTDPPYALVSIVKRFGKPGSAPAKGNEAYARASAGFMGKQWDTGEVAFDPEFWAECLRVLKPGGHLVAFSGTRTYHRMTVGIEDADFEIRDQIGWCFGQGFPKSHNAGNGWGTALKPAWEPIALARKPLIGTVAQNVLEHGTGAINVDGCRIKSWEKDQNLCDLCAGRVAHNKKPTIPAIKESTATRLAARTLSERELPSRGDISKTDIGCSDGTNAGNISISSNTSKSGKISSDQNQMDSISITKTKTEEITTSQICNSCQQPIIADITTSANQNGRWPANICHDGSEEVLAAFPETQSGLLATHHSRGNKTESVYGKFAHNEQEQDFGNDRGSAARFFYTAKADSHDRVGSKHPTVKPIDLMQWLVRLVTPKGGTVLDPFAGTGTTAEAAYREGMNCILIERETEYHADIRRRMALVLSGPDERARESIKAKTKDQPIDAGPLFGGVA